MANINDIELNAVVLNGVEPNGIEPNINPYTEPCENYISIASDKRNIKIVTPKNKTIVAIMPNAPSKKIKKCIY